MSDERGFVVGPEARVCLVRRHGGYAVAVVVDEGPFEHDAAELAASELRRRVSGKVTKREAAQILGISTKGVDYLRAQGVLPSDSEGNGRVLLDANSVHTLAEARKDQGV